MKRYFFVTLQYVLYHHNMSNKKKKITQSKFSKSIESKAANGEKTTYKLFVLYSLIWLAGIFIPQYYNVHYLGWSFPLYIVIPICLIAGLYLRFVRKQTKRHLWMSVWTCFCISFSSYTIGNVLYMAIKQESHLFTSTIYKAVRSGYRSPSAVVFELEGEPISLPYLKENIIKEHLENNHTITISGEYKKGLFSSILITDYSISDISTK